MRQVCEALALGAVGSRDVAVASAITRRKLARSNDSNATKGDSERKKETISYDESVK